MQRKIPLMTNRKKIWITWEIQRRNRTLSKKLSAKLFEVIEGGPRFKRYLISAWRTFKIIRDEQPDFLFVQNPSIVLCLWVIILKSYFNYTLIIDEHNSGLFPFEGKFTVVNAVSRWIARKADYVIITNQALYDIVQKWDANPLILPDPIPEFQNISPFSESVIKNLDLFHIVFICTWSSDEPFKNLLQAAEILGEGFKISITGNPKGMVHHDTVPGNVELTGFISEEEYVHLLMGADAITVLTTRENCLNCGAYEAIAMEKPLLLSRKQALMSYFRRGVVFTNHNPEEIAEALRGISEKKYQLQKEIVHLKKELILEWNGYMVEFEKMTCS